MQGFGEKSGNARHEIAEQIVCVRELLALTQRIIALQHTRTQRHLSGELVSSPLSCGEEKNGGHGERERLFPQVRVLFTHSRWTRYRREVLYDDTEALDLAMHHQSHGDLGRGITRHERGCATDSLDAHSGAHSSCANPFDAASFEGSPLNLRLSKRPVIWLQNVWRLPLPLVSGG